MGISHPEFVFKTTATEAAQAFSENIRGRTILITGVSPNSLGAALASAVSAQSPGLLILASRTPSKVSAVVRDIHASYPDVRTEVVAINLSSLKSVRKAAQHVKKIVGEGGIDILFNNAGINISERKLTDEGIEMQFGTNHVGPFLFTNLLLPLLLRPSTASSHSSPKLQKRIINTSSEAHRISPVRFSDWSLDPEKAARGEVEREDEPRRGLPKGVLRGGGVYEPAIAYGQSKSANVLFVIGLNERLLRGEGDRVVKSFAVMPGTIKTGLVRGLDENALKNLLEGGHDWKTLDQGAATLIVAAFDPGLDDEPGVYLDDCQMKRPSKWASDVGKAEKLWKLSEDLVGERFVYGKHSRL